MPLAHGLDDGDAEELMEGRRNDDVRLCETLIVSLLLATDGIG